MDWDAYTAWLEADPRHRDAFDAIALLDDDVMAQRARIAARLAPSPETRTRRWPWMVAASGAVAAALAVTIAPPRAAPDTVWQSGTAIRTIAFADGSRATLAPHSRLIARHADQAQLALTGDAYFDIPHRADRTLSIDAGGYRISDIGTRFEISTSGIATRVAVADGTLSVSAPSLARAVTLAKGHAFFARGDHVAVGAIGTDAVASWRHGTLVYDGAPLVLVAADIARYAGQDMTVDPAIADLRFSGTLTIGDGTKLAQTVATIAGLTARRDGDHVRLEPRRH
jgi:transmembrane sensor